MGPKGLTPPWRSPSDGSQPTSGEGSDSVEIPDGSQPTRGKDSDSVQIPDGSQPTRGKDSDSVEIPRRESADTRPVMAKAQTLSC
jgi:hypothetical protein